MTFVYSIFVNINRKQHQLDKMKENIYFTKDLITFTFWAKVFLMLRITNSRWIKGLQTKCLQKPQSNVIDKKQITGIRK